VADSSVTLPPTGAGSATPVFSTRTNLAGEHMEVVAVGIDGSNDVVPSSLAGGLAVTPLGETAGVGVGAAGDAEAVAAGSAIAVLKRLRTLLAGGLPAALVGGRLSVDASGVAVPVTDNAGSLTVDSAQLPAALVGARLDVNLGAAPATVTADTELPAAAALADAAGNPTAPAVGAFGLLWNGASWDRAPGTTIGQLAQGSVAHDAVDAGNPVGLGARAIAFGANPTAVAAADRTVLFANRAGVLFTLGGHPNTTTLELAFTAVQTDVAIVTVAGGLKIVVTAIAFVLDEATTVGVGFRVGFGAINTPTTTGVVLSHPGLIPGGGIVRGDGSGIIGAGADGEDLRLTADVPTTGSGRVVVSYFTIES